MKKCIVFLLVMAMAFGLSACNTPTQQNTETPTEESTAATTAPTVTSVAPAEVPTETPTTVATTAATAAPTVAATQADAQAPTAEPTEAATEQPHSDFYVPGVTPDQMVAYFNEVVLDMEYSTGEGDTSLVQKWNRPISYRIEGVPEHRDAQLINEFTKLLNQVEGFPGIRAATGLEQNVTISFLHDKDFVPQFAHLLKGERADGVVQFWWYNDTNEIYSGRIGYRKDASQKTRESVIPEEIVNLLGISDTVLRKDSITYQYSNEATEPSAVDWAIIKLLYNPKIRCGMNAAECETIIRELYY